LRGGGNRFGNVRLGDRWRRTRRRRRNPRHARRLLGEFFNSRWRLRNRDRRCWGPDCLNQAWRRKRRRRGLDRLRRCARLLCARTGFFRGFGGGLRKDVTLRQLNAALSREALDELARDDLFEGARRALELDAVILFQKLQHFRAAGSEQFRDFVNPNC
jgi:hypothetical protein